jgi:hypothetical protein
MVVITLPLLFLVYQIKDYKMINGSLVNATAYAIKDLNYPDLIEAMHKANIKGKGDDSNSCPLATYLNYLTKDSDITWSVGASGFGPIQDRDFYFDQSEAMHRFRKEFDAIFQFIAND